MYEFSDIKNWLSQPKSIAITTHQRPDGDAIGSSLALFHFLKRLGHFVTVVVPTDYPANLKFLPGNQYVVIAPFRPDRAKEVFEEADLIFCLDFNDITRINECGDWVMDSVALKIMIDHHTFPKDFDDFRYWDEKASSTAELVFRFIGELGMKNKLNANIAECLYLGLMTDTGSFRFDSTTPAVHRMAADLLQQGIEVAKIHERVFDSGTETRLRFIGHCLSHCLTVKPELKSAYFCIPKEVPLTFKIEAGDSEGLVNYALSIKGIEFATLLLEHEDIVKLSFRSKGDFTVNDFAAHFDGGGHIKASGGRFTGNIVDAETKFLAHLEEKNPVKAAIKTLE